MYQNESNTLGPKGKMADFIPLFTDDYKLAFCRATNNLPTLCQQNIWHLMTKGHIPPTPAAPLKISKRLQGHLDRWASRRKLTF